MNCIEYGGVVATGSQCSKCTSRRVGRSTIASDQVQQMMRKFRKGVEVDNFAGDPDYRVVWVHSISD